MTDILTDEQLIDNASCCAQFRPLCSGMEETNESLRECIKSNVCKPLREHIAELEQDLRAERAAHAETKAALRALVTESPTKAARS